MDKVVHFEIPADDMERAKHFYGSIFGWEITDMPMPGGMKYMSVVTAPVGPNRRPVEAGAINGGMIQRSEAMRAPILAINVPSIDESMQKVAAAGGKIVVPKMEMGGMGYYAYAADTEGNVIGLWEDIKKA